MAQEKRYDWGSFGFRDMDAKVVGPYLEEMSSKANEQLTPKMVVDDARSPTSPLHPAFQWDDKAAAEEFRLSQARQMIRTLRVTYEKSSEPTVPKRLFLHVVRNVMSPNAGVITERFYSPVVVVMKDDGMKRAVLEQALQELAAFQAKYRELGELADLFAVIRNIPRPPSQKKAVNQ